MHKKITKTLLLITLLVLLIGITSAATVSENTTTKVAKDKNTAPHSEVQKENEKSVEKNEKHATTEIIKQYNKIVKTQKDDGSFAALQKKINDATEGSTITLENDYENDGNFYKDGIVISNHITINGNGHTINASSKSRIFSIEANNVTLKNIKFNNGNSMDAGGAICVYAENCNIINSTFTNNMASEGGGAIYVGRGNCKINNSKFTNNSAFWYGGAIYNDGTVTIKDATLANNTVFRKFLIINNGMSISTYFVEGHGGAIFNNGNLTITNSNLIHNHAENAGGAINNNRNLNITNTNLNYNNAKTDGGAISNTGNLTITKSVFINNTAVKGAAIYNDLDALIDNNIFKTNEADNFTKRKAIINESAATIKNNINDEISIYYNTIYTNGKNVNITRNIFVDGIKNVKITVQPVKGIIGETITLQATLKDSDNLPVTGGNLAFKLNGKTLRSDGRFDSSAPAMKFSVKNGTVTHTIKADLYLRNAKNLTASYSGTIIYNETTSPSVTAQIQKRNAQITVSCTPTLAKQYETLTFKITAKDTTKNGKNNTLIYTGTKVMLKVNGVTLKDGNGKPLYLTLDKNAQTTYKYTIPAGTGGITASKVQRNYKLESIFVGDNYYPGARNSTSFQVERSPTTVTITQAKITGINVLSVKATLKDYKGNNLIGTNKVTIKINGKSYTKNNKPVYWSVKNGNVDLTGIQVNPKTTIKRVLLVTGERQAYLEGRSETTNILRG